MCFSRPSTPAVVRTDPERQQREAQNQAAERTNREAVERTTRRRRTALATQGAGIQQGTAGTALQSYGQRTLGNGL
jgi:hypothetical protein